MSIRTTFFLVLTMVFVACGGRAGSAVIYSDGIKDTNATVSSMTSISKNIMVIYQDSKSHYWFGSWEDGLYQYNGKSLTQFTTFHGLAANRIEEIKEDKWGNVYVNTTGGVCVYRNGYFDALAEPGTSDTIWRLHADDVWFKCSNHAGHVYRYDGKMLHKLKLPKVNLAEEFRITTSSTLSPYDVYSIYTDSKGNVWFGTAVAGAMRYNGESFDWILEKDVTEFHDGPSNGVRSIMEDEDGYFWFNTSFRYDVYGNQKDDEKFYSKLPGIGNLDGNAGGDLNEYLSIARDNQNDIWIVTYTRGVWRYTGEKIIHYPVKDRGVDITLFSIFVDNQGELWLGTHASGVFKFDGENFEKFTP